MSAALLRHLGITDVAGLITKMAKAGHVSFKEPSDRWRGKNPKKAREAERLRYRKWYAREIEKRREQSRKRQRVWRARHPKLARKRAKEAMARLRKRQRRMSGR